MYLRHPKVKDIFTTNINSVLSSRSRECQVTIPVYLVFRAVTLGANEDQEMLPRIFTYEIRIFTAFCLISHSFLKPGIVTTRLLFCSNEVREMPPALIVQQLRSLRIYVAIKHA